jgi:O-antigen/teichoic acid export membrane protein
VDSIARGTLFNLLSRVGMLAMGMGITVITARIGTREQGIFALFTTAESILLTLFSGFGVALARRISHHRERPTGLVGAIALACVGMGIVAAGVLLALSSWGGSDYGAMWILALASPFLLIAPNLSGIWLALGRMATMARISVAAPLLCLLGMGGLLSVRSALGIDDVLWSWVIAKTVVGCGVLLATRRAGWLGRPNLAALSAQWRFVGVIGITNVIGLMNYKIDLLLVQHFLGLSATGLYSVAVIVGELLWFVSSSVTQAAYARIGTADALEASSIVVRVVHCSFLALLLASPLVWFAAAALLPWALGERYLAALPALAILLPGILAFGAASALSAFFTNHAGRPGIPALLASLSLAVNVVISCVLIPRLGIIGGAIATSVSYATAIVASFWMFLRMSGTPLGVLLRPDWRSIFRDLRSAARRPG